MAEFKPDIKSFIDVFDMEQSIYLVPWHGSYDTTRVFETLFSSS